MSLRTAIYRRLADDPELVAMLATKPAAVGNGPAIYETWAAPETETPYINLGYSFGAGPDKISRRGTLDIDIFVDGYDTTVIEDINRRIKGLLHSWHVYEPQDGPVFLDLENETPIPEDSEGVQHWNLTFLVRHWDKSVIAAVINR